LRCWSFFGLRWRRGLGDRRLGAQEDEEQGAGHQNEGACSSCDKEERGRACGRGFGGQRLPAFRANRISGVRDWLIAIRQGAAREISAFAGSFCHGESGKSRNLTTHPVFAKRVSFPQRHRSALPREKRFLPWDMGLATLPGSAGFSRTARRTLVIYWRDPKTCRSPSESPGCSSSPRAGGFGSGRAGFPAPPMVP